MAFITFLFSGLAAGCVYGLVGLSLTLIYNCTRIINFAQGDFVMLGTMLAVLFLATLGWPRLPAVLLTVCALGLAGAAMERLVYRPLVQRRAAPLTIMIGTMAFGIILAGAVLVGWGPNQMWVPGIFGSDPVQLGPLMTTPQQLAIIGLFGLLVLATWLFLHRTTYGVVVRATGYNPETASLMGVRVQRVIVFTFAFAGVYSALAGILVGPILGGSFNIGLFLSVKGFMAAILGGLASPFAAAAGGVLLGVVESLVAGYGNSLYAEPIVFVLMLLILLVKPSGLFMEARDRA